MLAISNSICTCPTDADQHYPVNGDWQVRMRVGKPLSLPTFFIRTCDRPRQGAIHRGHDAGITDRPARFPSLFGLADTRGVWRWSSIFPSYRTGTLRWAAVHSQPDMGCRSSPHSQDTSHVYPTREVTSLRSYSVGGHIQCPFTDP